MITNDVRVGLFRIFVLSLVLLGCEKAEVSKKDISLTDGTTSLNSSATPLTTTPPSHSDSVVVNTMISKYKMTTVKPALPSGFQLYSYTSVATGSSFMDPIISKTTGIIHGNGTVSSGGSAKSQGVILNSGDLQSSAVEDPTDDAQITIDFGPTTNMTVTINFQELADGTYTVNCTQASLTGFTLAQTYDVPMADPYNYSIITHSTDGAVDFTVNGM